MNNKESFKPRIVKSGEMMTGICTQWIIDEHGSNKTIMRAISLYVKIARKTFGYRNRYGYIQQDYFKMHSQQLKDHRDILVKAKLIEWKATKQMTMYRILEPADRIKEFVFVRTNTEEPIEESTENNKYNGI